MHTSISHSLKLLTKFLLKSLSYLNVKKLPLFQISAIKFLEDISWESCDLTVARLMSTEDKHSGFTLVHGSSPKAEFSEALMTPDRPDRLIGIRAMAMVQGLSAESMGATAL